MTTPTVPTTVHDLAAAVAAEMREKGVYRKSGTPNRFDGSPVCIYVNAASHRAANEHNPNWDLTNRFEDAVRERAADDNIVNWVNESTDEEIFRVLDEIAADSTPAL